MPPVRGARGKAMVFTSSTWRRFHATTTYHHLHVTPCTPHHPRINRWVSCCLHGCTTWRLTTPSYVFTSITKVKFNNPSPHWLNRCPLASPSFWSHVQSFQGSVHHSPHFLLSVFKQEVMCSPLERSSDGVRAERGWEVDFTCGICSGAPTTREEMLSWVFPRKNVLYRRWGTKYWWGEIHSPGAGSWQPIGSGMLDRILELIQKGIKSVIMSMAMILGSSLPLNPE